MDGVFTTCRSTPECTRLDRHEGACNVPVVVRRRTPANRLKYLARELERGEAPDLIAASLRVLAAELE